MTLTLTLTLFLTLTLTLTLYLTLTLTQLARLRVPLRLSRHTHLLCTLQRAFGHLMAEVQQEIGRRQQGQPAPAGAAERTHRLALALRAAATELLGELRARPSPYP